MNGNFQIRAATVADVACVSSILSEAAAWLAARGTPMWKADELVPARIAADVADGLFVLAEVDGAAAGTLRFQREDPEFWPDRPAGEAAYVHRLAVRRAFAGRGVSAALLNWAAAQTRSIGRCKLRLDCEAARPKLRALYEGLGFRHHSDRQVGPYFVARYERTLASGERT